MIRYLLLSFLQRTPLFLVLLGGLLVALGRWNRHSSVSLITAVGIVLYIIKLVVFSALSYWVPTLRSSMDWSYETVNNVFTVIHILSDIGYALFIIVLVTAAFLHRNPKA